MMSGESNGNVPAEEEDKLLNTLRFRTLKEKELVTFPEVSRVFSFWRIRRYQRNALLHSLEQRGKIRIIDYKGIIVNDAEPQ